MRRQVLLLICLMLGAASFSGCATKYRMTGNELMQPQHQSHKIKKAVLPTRISSVTLKPQESEVRTDTIDGVVRWTEIPATEPETVEFGQNGGTIDTAGGIVSGVDTTGEHMEFPLAQVQYVQIMRSDSLKFYVTPESYLTNARRAADVKLTDVKRGEFFEWDVVKFKGGGVVDTDQQSLTGRSERGKPVELNLPDVALAEYSISRPYKTLRIFVSLGVMAAFGLGISTFTK